MDLFDRIVKEYGLPLYNPNVAIYAVNMNEALNFPKIAYYVYHQPIFLEIIRMASIDRVQLIFKNRFGKEINWIYYDYTYDRLKEATLYSIQQIKEYRQKLKLEAIEKDFK